LALGYGFDALALSEIVSFTSAANLRLQAVTERLGMHRDPAEDFDHPALPDRQPPSACALPSATRAIMAVLDKGGAPL